MPKYEVIIKEVIEHTVRVWAEDTDEAIKNATELITLGEGTFTESNGLNTDSAWVEELEGDE